MARSSSPPQALIDESALTAWEVIDSGGFGQVSKARHKHWCFDVAVKLLHYDNGNSRDLLREVEMMREGSSPYVIQVLGVFHGRPPFSQSAQLGLVMELMERGSLASLQKTLCERPPWPLVFRLAHQVALGINFLHSLSPPLLHRDLKPNNVLLDPFLNAKLTDFGLAKFYYSVSRGSRTNRNEGGTTGYMPPEAFQLSYKPAKASDIYSYGILLWSILAWKKPYEDVVSSLVRLKIPQGERPSMEELRSGLARPEGFKGLIELMERCWDTNPSQRPTSLQCASKAETMFIRHNHQIVDVVHQVLKEMDSKKPAQQCHRYGVCAVNAANGIDVLTGRPPVQEEAGGCTGNQRDVSRRKGSSPTQLSYVSDTDSAPNHVKPSSDDPPPPRPSTPGGAEESRQQAQSHAQPQSQSAVDSAAAASQRLPSNHDTPNRQAAPGLERQFSDPPLSKHTLDCGPIFNKSVVTGVQYGNNNVMNINVPQRRRHPTAPFSTKQRGGNRKTPGNPG